MKKTLIVGLLGTLPLFTLVFAKLVQTSRRNKVSEAPEGGMK